MAEISGASLSSFEAWSFHDFSDEERRAIEDRRTYTYDFEKRMRRILAKRTVWATITYTKEETTFSKDGAAKSTFDLHLMHYSDVVFRLVTLKRAKLIRSTTASGVVITGVIMHTGLNFVKRELLPYEPNPMIRVIHHTDVPGEETYWHKKHMEWMADGIAVDMKLDAAIDFARRVEKSPGELLSFRKDAFLDFCAVNECTPNIAAEVVTRVVGFLSENRRKNILIKCSPLCNDAVLINMKTVFAWMDRVLAENPDGNPFKCDLRVFGVFDSKFSTFVCDQGVAVTSVSQIIREELRCIVAIHKMMTELARTSVDTSEILQHVLDLDGGAELILILGQTMQYAYKKLCVKGKKSKLDVRYFNVFGLAETQAPLVRFTMTAQETLLWHSSWINIMLRHGDAFTRVTGPRPRHVCCVCGIPAAKLCSGCKSSWYCGKNCQKNDIFAGHRKLCTPKKPRKQKKKDDGDKGSCLNGQLKTLEKILGGQMSRCTLFIRDGADPVFERSVADALSRAGRAQPQPVGGAGASWSTVPAEDLVAAVSDV